MNARHGSAALLSMGLGLALLWAPPPTWAADPFVATTGAEKPAKARKPKQAKPPADKGYGENKAERDKRLLRECRGKPNAGACEGYAL